MADQVAHEFGGAWTEIKLDAVEYYLKCFTKALSAIRMDLWYIDAFAGTGDRESKREVGGILEGRPIDIVTETLDGSARRAMKVNPPFSHFVFIEQDAARCAALRSIPTAGRDLTVLQGDANSELIRLAARYPWSQRGASRSRGVVFLDPYSLQVEWSTLCALAETRSLDVWYLFPLRDVVRQLAHDYSGIGFKEAKLDAILSPAWRDLYAMPEPSGQDDIFRDLFTDRAEMKRNASMRQIEAWFRQRLATKFAFVSEPLPILTSPTRQAFSLFLCVANPSKAATDLAEKFVVYVNRKYAPASRRRSGR